MRNVLHILCNVVMSGMAVAILIFNVWYRFAHPAMTETQLFLATVRPTLGMFAVFWLGYWGTKLTAHKE